MKEKKKYCPTCGKRGLNRDGQIQTTLGYRQNYECKFCGSKTIYPKSQDKSPPQETLLLIKQYITFHSNALKFTK